MHSVVNVGDDNSDIKIYHKSFSDFLLDPSRLNEPVANVEDMHDSLFSHLIGTSKHRDTILQVLGQSLVSESMAPDVDILDTPATIRPPAGSR